MTDISESVLFSGFKVSSKTASFVVFKMLLSDGNP